MRNFVAGATGAVGCRLVPLLVGDGHTVIGLTRTPVKAGFVRELGAEAVVADALDQRSIHAAIDAARPDVIVNELTDLKGASDLRRFDRAFANSNRLRTSGTDYLLAAARDCGVKRMVVQSFCGWPYARSGGQVKSEEDPLDPNPPREQDDIQPFTMLAVGYRF
jgi:nucleoside-diphosphate-sugar epimerase